MALKENTTTSSRKYSKSLYFLVLLIIGFGACQTVQNEETENSPVKQSEVPLVTISKVQKDIFPLNEEKIKELKW